MLFVCFLIIFTFSIAGILRIVIRGREEQASFNNLSVVVDQTSVLEAMARMNSDFAGWLKVPGTKIDYPVMFTPDDPEYYLYRSFDKEETVSGTPFIGAGCNTASDCFIIYAHNMKNNTMFGTLDYYQEEAFWRENPFFQFDTLQESRTYEVVAVFHTEMLPTGVPDLPYYKYCGLLNETAYNELLTQIKARELYDTGVEVRYGEQLLLLSTCSYNTDNGRFVVVARNCHEKERSNENNI